jgi:hypothetical protein
MSPSLHPILRAAVAKQVVKTTEIYCFIILENRSLKSRIWHSWFILEAPRENLLLACLLTFDDT